MGVEELILTVACTMVLTAEWPCRLVDSSVLSERYIARSLGVVCLLKGRLYRTSQRLSTAWIHTRGSFLTRCCWREGFKLGVARVAFRGDEASTRMDLVFTVISFVKFLARVESGDG